MEILLSPTQAVRPENRPPFGINTPMEELRTRAASELTQIITVQLGSEGRDFSKLRVSVITLHPHINERTNQPYAHRFVAKT